MKRTTWVFGLVSGAVSIFTMALTLPAIESGRLGLADVVGYTSMLLSALILFFGMRQYRERVEGGRLSFLRAMAVGILISLISSACYIVAFEVLYFKVAPDFGEKFSSCMVERVREDGGSSEEIERAAEQARTLKRLYDHPATNAVVSFVTTFPLGLAVTTISALILRRS